MQGRFRARGYLRSVDADGSTHENDTFTCRHCQRVVDVPHMGKPEDVGGLCTICMGAICPRCVAKGACDPFEEKLKRMEASYQARRWMGL